MKNDESKEVLVDKIVKLVKQNVEDLEDITNQNKELSQRCLDLKEKNLSLQKELESVKDRNEVLEFSLRQRQKTLK